jgi:hypothetical protein
MLRNREQVMRYHESALTSANKAEVRDCLIRRLCTIRRFALHFCAHVDSTKSWVIPTRYGTPVPKMEPATDRLGIRLRGKLYESRNEQPLMYSTVQSANGLDRSTGIVKSRADIQQGIYRLKCMRSYWDKCSGIRSGPRRLMTLTSRRILLLSGIDSRRGYSMCVFRICSYITAFSRRGI